MQKKSTLVLVKELASAYAKMAAEEECERAAVVWSDEQIGDVGPHY